MMFTRRINRAVAALWCDLFWSYASEGISPTFKHGMDWRGAAWQAQEHALDAFSRRGIGIYFLYGKLDAFVKHNGQLLDR